MADEVRPASQAAMPDTMEGLRRQNSAYRALCASLEAQMAILTAKGREYQEAVTTLDSEREANAILTAENARLTEENERLREALVAEREENLWNAYHAGSVRDGKWNHLCMSDGEWLARECGFNVSDCRFDDEAIRAAIPKAARKALAHKDVNANIGGTDA
jgi:hypothetical protein